MGHQDPLVVAFTFALSLLVSLELMNWHSGAKSYLPDFYSNLEGLWKRWVVLRVEALADELQCQASQLLERGKKAFRVRLRG